MGAIEPQFYEILVKGLGLDIKQLPKQMDQGSWPTMKKCFEYIFASKTREQWELIFDSVDACVTPVLSFDELSSHPHTNFRNLVVNLDDGDGDCHISPAPRLSRTPAVLSNFYPAPGQNTLQILREHGYQNTQISSLVDLGAVSTYQSNL